MKILTKEQIVELHGHIRFTDTECLACCRVTAQAQLDAVKPLIEQARQEGRKEGGQKIINAFVEHGVDAIIKGEGWYQELREEHGFND